MIIRLSAACKRVGISVSAYEERLRGRTKIPVPFPCFHNEANRRMVQVADIEAYFRSGKLVRVAESCPRSTVRVAFGGKKEKSK